MNFLDTIVIAIVALSALIAFARGFVREALSIAAWVGAGLVALYGMPYALPIVQRFITQPQLAYGAAGIAMFLVSLVFFSIITSMIASRVKQSSLSAVDRALGLLFGMARGVVIACLGFMALDWALHGERDSPAWIREARTRPFLASGADFIKGVVPAQTRERGATAAAEAQHSFEQAREAERLIRQLTTPSATASSKAPSGTAGGYKPTERREMDRLIETTQ